MTELQSCAWC